MSHYLITGGAGFIGSHLCELLLTCGHRVRVVDDLSAGTRDNLPVGIELWVADAADPAVMCDAIAEVDGAFHLAAIASVEGSRKAWLGGHRVNQLAALVVLDVVRAARRIPVVFASSAAVYGDGGNCPLTESALLRPISAYGADKAGVELHARAAWKCEGTPTAALRIFNVFGARQKADSPYAGVIAAFADRMKRGEPFRLYGDGQQSRDFISVEDVARHLVAAMASLETQPRHLLCNVCTGHAITIEALARRMAALNGIEPTQIEFLSARTGEVRHSCGDPRLAIAELGIRAQTDLDGGLRALFGNREPQ